MQWCLRFCTLSLSLFLFSMLARSSSADDFTFHHENVLGTSLELHVQCDTEAAAREAEERTLQEIERLEKIFSHYDPSSEFSKFVNAKPGTISTLSHDLRELLKRCNEWNQVSHGAFQPGVQGLTHLWKNAAETSTMPTSEAIERARELAVTKHWSIAEDNASVTRLSSQKLTLNAIAKGTILDAVINVIERDCPTVDGCMVNIGGDLRVAGTLAENVSIPHPFHDAIGGKIWKKLSIKDAAIATSGNSERYFTIGGQRLSHIIDPRTGMPATNVVSATVMAPTAETADVLATICSVMNPAEALHLVESIPGCSCCLMLEDETVFCSVNWVEATQETATEESATPYEMNVEFEITKPENSGRWRRPYVAVWIEDQDEYPVKTLSLFLMANNPGPRWHRDLRRWYASDQLRLLSDEMKLIGTVSKPTRNAGNYKVAWDGKDDHGKVLKEGKYTLYIEAAREHGTYQLIKYPFELGAKSFEDELKGNVEIKTAKVQFSKKP